ncbi:hypothetical protein BS50DRAFT_512848 [Corynespora cassiicola Philippines]|uniref:Ubiquitin 3 binding protein But2 C-terminal domain-containing protein n=1 Tax=Corynespora cassiicola Philippines TaxID=1448308 RepID=A0A2T2PC58_CORCC|nr:hypothetical protein BS50DRAFT_512848 [Corynespora cassiicola Philippines]
MSRHLIVLASSIFLILVIAISLATSLQIRAPPRKMIQISLAQAAKEKQYDRDLKAKGRVNGTGFDRGDILSGTLTISPGKPSTLYLSLTAKPEASSDSMANEGMIGLTPTPQMSPSSMNEGYIGPIPTSSPAPPKPTPQPPAAPAAPQVPILALSYESSGGPKHCRGELLQKISFSHPAKKWKNGTCVDLPNDARCGVFYAGKDDNCEAQLFNMPRCYNTSETYVNTVVFMPEERAVGALWRSMYVRCGVEAPEAGILDPSILGALLNKPGGGNSGKRRIF